MSWLDNAVIYEIFIDRFAGFTDTSKSDQPVYVGGNIRGIIDKLPYIKDLGVNAIWITPFYSGVDYHGYRITDFYGVDEHFGTEKDVSDLIESAHNLGIKVIADFVFNHCSNDHPFFKDAVANKDSEYRNWFIFKKWPSDYRCFLSYGMLPKLNMDNNQTRLHIQGAAKKWLSIGFDGLRLDHVVGVSNDNLRKLISPLRLEFPNAVFFGEACFDGIKFSELKTIKSKYKYLIWLFRLKTILYQSYVGILDGVLDFKTVKYFKNYAFNDNVRYKQKIIKKYNNLKREITYINFLDNHDMERFLFLCDGDVDKLKRAIDLQLSLNDPMVIYYGTEIGMSQSAPFSSLKGNADLLTRQPMQWDISKQNSDLLKYYKTVISAKIDH